MSCVQLHDWSCGQLGAGCRYAQPDAGCLDWPQLGAELEGYVQLGVRSLGRAGYVLLDMGSLLHEGCVLPDMGSLLHEGCGQLGGGFLHQGLVLSTLQGDDKTLKYGSQLYQVLGFLQCLKFLVRLRCQQTRRVLDLL